MNSPKLQPANVSLYTVYGRLQKKFPKFHKMFMNIREHFANVHVHITSRMYVHEQFTKYHELFAKVRELGGNFLQPTVGFEICKYVMHLMYGSLASRIQGKRYSWFSRYVLKF